MERAGKRRGIRRGPAGRAGPPHTHAIRADAPAARAGSRALSPLAGRSEPVRVSGGSTTLLTCRSCPRGPGHSAFTPMWATPTWGPSSCPGCVSTWTQAEEGPHLPLGPLHVDPLR